MVRFIQIVTILGACVSYIQSACDDTPLTGDCLAANGVCFRDSCYCVADQGGADCTETCGTTCTADKVCTGTDSCEDCSTITCAIADGACASADGQVVCKCVAGKAGADCTKAACTNAASCSDHGTCEIDALCDCATVWTGDACDTVDCAATTPCGTNGNCVGGACVCDNGFTGELCETKLCTTTNCAAANGDCQDDVCLCKEEKFGADCTTACATAACTGDDVCTSNTIGDCIACSPACDADGGECRSTGAAGSVQAKCFCNDGYSGDGCTTNIDDCVPNPCINGGTCTDGVNSFTCDCTADWAGTTCSITACKSNDDCKNGGACTSKLCVCTGQWAGTTCENEKCDTSNPCENGGTCGTDSLCDCDEGYDGDMCENSSSQLLVSLALLVSALVAWTVL